MFFLKNIQVSDLIKSLGKVIPLIKVFNDQENHNGFQYKEGLNELTEEFFPYSESCSGGFYFTASRIEFYGFLGKKK